MGKQQVRAGGRKTGFCSKRLAWGMVGSAILMGSIVSSRANADVPYVGGTDPLFPSSSTDPFVFGQALPAPAPVPYSSSPIDITVQQPNLPAVGIPLAPYGSLPPATTGTGGGSSLAANAFNYVLVDSRDNAVLQQVRAIEPKAYFRPLINGQTVIQAGAFTSFSRAEQRARELQLAGISGVTVAIAEGGDPFAGPGIPATGAGGVVTLPPTPTTPGFPTTPTTPGFPTTPTDLSYRPNIPFNANAYYVVVPSRREDLNSVSSRIWQLGQNSLSYGAIQPRLSPRGPHVAVGPFTERGSAETWTRYLREVGQMDARVFYGRYDGP